ncbi:MAG: DUF3800 domain-containing protein [Lachnospiraceae bacterium]|jgi:hypothetical protein|nr:DUF3800 domain-containing protein [Lachnospiraceae bacterium]MCI1301837.1 DUF3800 domain-containing protein [Lachnospiraceae bacterium]MCI1331349.1 DUF3800 domain-containing protein [Lachnospiraceae bacterium]
MNIYVYSDESGVFDKVHNDVYVFGGLILLGKDKRDICIRKYQHVEKTLRGKYPASAELKADLLTNKDKGKIYRSLNNEYKFAAIVDEKRVNENIFKDKKSKQRYLDFVYKIALKNALSVMINNSIFSENDVEHIIVNYDEHTTATNGRYELREALLQELKIGTFNWNYNIFYKPLIECLIDVQTNMCDSKNVTLIRAADIIANKVYHSALENFYFNPCNKNIYIKRFP